MATQNPTLHRIMAVVFSLLVAAHGAAQDTKRLSNGLIFHVSFDDVTDVNLFGNHDGGWAFTADSVARETVQQGDQIPGVSIVKGAGRVGDALRFTKKTKQVLCYKASVNGIKPSDNWSGTVSVWMKLDPDQDLPEGFCDPIQITAKKWNDAAFFIDFDKDVPRDFRLGVFSDHDVWNSKNIKWEDFPVAERPMVTVKKPPFSRDKWTHVAFTFANINSTTDKPSTAVLYLNGKRQGAIRKPMKFTWPKADDETKEAMIMLGINYVGDMDELAIWQRALSDEEIMQLYLHPEKT